MYGKLGGLLLVVGLALLGLPGPASADQNATINESEFKLDPNAVNATAGQVVHFTIKNAGTIEHNFTVELPSASIEKKLFDSNLKPGETRTVDFTFAQAGAWEMYCPLDKHEDLGMKGGISVTAAAAATSAPPAAPSAPAPAAPPLAPAPVVAPAPPPPAAAAAPATQPAPTAIPPQLPKTGGPVLPLAVTLTGLALLGAGLAARRRR